ncbi:MAG: ribose-5-phosphate isomerase A [Phycisphaerae bacterium]|jgi:ribose 5-phosphate isomerase A|nr:MAG: ribose-5-phosphate isomerase A [Phycisphaerae bacterium]
MNAKTRAAEAALNHIQNDMIVGLGSGSTASIFIELLCQAVREGRFKNIRGVPTSIQSEKLARQGGLALIDLKTAGRCDVTVDGADEVDPDLNLIKGLGGALLREKIVAQNTEQFIAIVDESKVVPYLGHHCPLPVEVTQFAYEVHAAYIQSLGARVEQRRNPDGSAFTSDNGNYYFHCHFGRIDRPAELDQALRNRAGIIETGLFIRIAKRAIVAGESGVRELTCPADQ